MPITATGADGPSERRPFSMLTAALSVRAGCDAAKPTAPQRTITTVPGMAQRRNVDWTGA